MFVELLRGRDGLPGRDGAPGKDGNQGPQGPPGLRGLPGPRSGGAIYTRWGKSSCPQIEGTALVYSGITGGSWFGHTGGGANHLCMPKDPENVLSYGNGEKHWAAFVYGTEYEHPLQGTHDHGVPCAVCYVTTRSTVLMIPAKASCPTNYTKEYNGYLMADHHGHKRTMFVCVDGDQESLPGSVGNQEGALLYHVEARCGTSLPCPPYDTKKELNCVVCTK